MPDVSRRTALKAGLACAACAAVPNMARAALLRTGTLGRFVIRIAQHPVLGSVNGSKIFVVPGVMHPDPQSEIVVTRQAGNTFSALSAVCTHAGCQVDPYNAAIQRLPCPCHGSMFRLDGTVAQGPAVRPLQRFTATYDASSNSVFVDLPDFVSAEAGADAPVLDLAPPAPHPVTTEARLRYTLPAPGPVRVEVFDAAGRRVAVLVDGLQAAGPHSAAWDARATAPGTYVVRLTAAGEVRTRAVTVAR
jgi:nitrite reductase/ring-hydroxylating ferredoxin subunit